MKSGPGGIRGAAPIPYQTGSEMLGADEVSDAGHGLGGFAKAAAYPTGREGQLKPDRLRNST